MHIGRILTVHTHRPYTDHKSAENWPYIDHNWLCIDHKLAAHWPQTGRTLTTHWSHTDFSVGPYAEKHWLTLTSHWPYIDHKLTANWLHTDHTLTTHRPYTDSKLTMHWPQIGRTLSIHWPYYHLWPHWPHVDHALAVHCSHTDCNSWKNKLTSRQNQSPNPYARSRHSPIFLRLTPTFSPHRLQYPTQPHWFYIIWN